MLESFAFDPKNTRAFVGYDAPRAKRFWSRVDRLIAHFGIETTGIEHLPPRRALLVMNHAFGWDCLLPMAAIRRATGRRVWVLGEHLWWKIPFVRNIAAAIGTVDGNTENVDALLEADELVLVLPGGIREAVKPRELRYRLLWGNRYGFVRAAIRNAAPLVPVAGIGPDEWIDLTGDSFARGKRWLGIDFPLPRPRWGLPIIHRMRPRYVIGPPISTEPRPGEPPDAAAHRLRREVRGALEEIIDESLAQRAGVHP